MAKQQRDLSQYHTLPTLEMCIRKAVPYRQVSEIHPRHVNEVTKWYHK